MDQAVHKRTIADIPIFEYQQVTSTQDIARNLIKNGEFPEENNHDSVLLGVVSAEFQKSGRGRLDRTWQARESSSMLTTFILRKRHSQPMVDVALLLISATNFLESKQIEVGIKWPNDLVDKNSHRKFGGCLSEIEDEHLLVGIGINVSSGSYPEELKETALDLEEAGYTGQPKDVIDGIVNQYMKYARSDVNEIWSAYRQHSVTIDSDVKIETPDAVFNGHAVDVDNSGGLIVDLGDGERITVNVGDVVRLRPS